MTRIGVPMVMMLALLAATGCGSTNDVPRYRNSSLCGVPTHLVTAVSGTDRITWVRRGTGGLPIAPNSYGFRCSITIPDRDVPDLEFDVKRVWSRDLDQSRHNASTANYHSKFANGLIGYNAKKDDGGYDFSGWWVCGQDSIDGTQMAYVTASSKLSASRRDFEALLRALGAAAGCG